MEVNTSFCVLLVFCNANIFEDMKAGTQNTHIRMNIKRGNLEMENLHNSLLLHANI